MLRSQQEPDQAYSIARARGTTRRPTVYNLHAYLGQINDENDELLSRKVTGV